MRWTDGERERERESVVLLAGACVVRVLHTLKEEKKGKKVGGGGGGEKTEGRKQMKKGLGPGTAV